jgi:hypothetical protein
MMQSGQSSLIGVLEGRLIFLSSYLRWKFLPLPL